MESTKTITDMGLNAMEPQVDGMYVQHPVGTSLIQQNFTKHLSQSVLKVGRNNVRILGDIEVNSESLRVKVRNTEFGIFSIFNKNVFDIDTFVLQIFKFSN